MQRFFQAPLFPSDDQKTRLASSLDWLMKVILIIMLIYAVIGSKRPAALVAIAVIILTTLVIMGVSRQGHIRAAAFIYLFFLSLITFITALDSGGVRSVAFSGGGFFMVLAAGLLLSWRGTLVFMTIFAILGSLLVWLELAGMLPPIRGDLTPVNNLAIFVLILLGSAGLTVRVTSGTEASLARLQTEVSKRQKIEAALQLSERRYRLLAQNLPDSAIVLYDHDLRFVLVDGPEVERTGYSKARMEGRTLHEALPPEFAQLVEPNMRRVLAGEQFSAELPFEDSFYSYHYVPLRDETGEIVLGMILAQNVTHRARLEAELQRYAHELEYRVEQRTGELRLAKEQIEAVLHHTRDAIALVGANGDVQLANPAFTRLFGERAAQAVEYILWSLADDQIVHAAAQEIVAAFRAGERRTLTTRVELPGGDRLDIDLALEPVETNSGARAHSIVLSAHDITHIRELERLKERFLANAVHDLSAPISGLSTRLYLLRRAPEQLDRHVASLESQVQHLSHLLEDLRTLSQLDRGMIILNRVPTHLNAIVQRVFDTYEPVALQKRQTLRLVTDPNIAEALLDDRKIERVVVNLVANAINYTPEERVITIRSAREASSLLLEVEDQGIGINEDDQQRVFDRFFRADAARSHASGTGLGLAIVKEVVELHGGSVSVRSEIGRGSTFTVRLPVI